MSANQADLPIAVMVRTLGASKAGDYAWAGRRVAADAALLKRIRTLPLGSRQTCGAPHPANLREQGERSLPEAHRPSDARPASSGPATGAVDQSRPDAIRKHGQPTLIDRTFGAATPTSSGSRTSHRYCRRISWSGACMEVRDEPATGTDRRDPCRDGARGRAASPRGTVATRLRDEFSALYEDEDFRDLYPTRGQPGLAPWRLALVTVLQFSEHLSDRQAADAVRARIDWKYALGLELTDPGFHFSVLTEFRTRLIAGGGEQRLLDRMLARFKARGLVKARGKQRTDSTHVLAAVHDLHLLELVAETLRAALDDLAAVAPDWLRGIAQPVWFERYGRRVEDYRLPKAQAEREALALAIGADGFALLEALDASEAPPDLRGCADGAGPCGTCGGCIMPAREAGRRAGAAALSCRQSASDCNRPTTRRCTTARNGRWNGRATRCMSPKPATWTRLI